MTSRSYQGRDQNIMVRPTQYVNFARVTSKAYQGRDQNIMVRPTHYVIFLRVRQAKLIKGATKILWSVLRNVLIL